MQTSSFFFGILAVILLAFPTDSYSQACMGRPLRVGGRQVGLSYEPQVDGWGGVFHWNAPGMWGLRVLGGSLGELIDQEELDTFQEWTKIGTTTETAGEEVTEYPIVTRRAKEDYFGAEGLVELLLSDFSICAVGGVHLVYGEADLNQRITYLVAIGPRWVRSMQDYSGVRTPLTLAVGHRGIALAQVRVAPYAGLTYWVDRVTFDRVDEGFTYEGWYGEGGATFVLEGISLGLGFRTGDDLRDGSLLAYVGYTF